MSHHLRSVVDCLQSLASRQHQDGMSDAALLRCFVDSRSEGAFSCLMRRHGAMVLGLARRIVRDQQLAEDVFQATFLILARKAPSIRARESLPAWLHRVALRLATRAKRSQRRLLEQHTRPLAASSRDPLDEMSAREMLAILDEELARLPEKYRAPLILCHLEGLSQHEAAKRLDVRPGSIKGLLERGRLLLRKRFSARGLPAGAALAGALELESAAHAVPATLLQATLQAALTSQGATAAAVALAEGAILMMTAAKIKAVCLAVLLLGIVGAGAGWMAQGGGPGQKDTPEPRRAKPAQEVQAVLQPGEKPKAVDLYGDPLPGRSHGAVPGHTGATGSRCQPGFESRRQQTLVGVRGGKLCQPLGRGIRQAQGNPKNCRGVFSRESALSPDGRFLAADDLKVWDVRTGELYSKLTLIDTKRFRCRKVKERQRFPQTATTSLSIAWDRESKNHFKSPRVPSRRILRPYLQDLATAQTGLCHGTSRYCQPRAMDRGQLVLLQTASENRLLVSFGVKVYCWNVADGRELWKTNDVFAAGNQFVFTPDGGKMLAFTNAFGLVAMDLVTGKASPLPNSPPRERISTMHPILMLPDGRTLLLSNPDGVFMWDLETGTAVRTLAGAGEDMVLSPDGKKLITNSGVLQRWDLATGKALFVDNFDKGHAQEIVDLVFSADGKRLASCADDGSVRLWTRPRPSRSKFGADMRLANCVPFIGSTRTWRAGEFPGQ